MTINVSHMCMWNSRNMFPEVRLQGWPEVHQISMDKLWSGNITKRHRYLLTLLGNLEISLTLDAKKGKKHVGINPTKTTKNSFQDSRVPALQFQSQQEVRQFHQNKESERWLLLGNVLCKYHFIEKKQYVVPGMTGFCLNKIWVFREFVAT